MERAPTLATCTTSCPIPARRKACSSEDRDSGRQLVELSAHKHDQDNLPHESQLEETYYHRLDPPQGYGFEDLDVVLVPKAYYPVGAPHGYDLFYLNVMVGATRIGRFHNDLAHAWMLTRS